MYGLLKFIYAKKLTVAFLEFLGGRGEKETDGSI